MPRLYTAVAHVEGGRDGTGRTDDGKLDVALSAPTELGGAGAGTNPEQLFAVGYAACFQSALGTVARQRGLVLTGSSIDSMVTLISEADGTFRIEVALDVTVPEMTDEAAVELIQAAHLICPYSNAIRGNVDVILSVNNLHVAGNLAEIEGHAGSGMSAPR